VNWRCGLRWHDWRRVHTTRIGFTLNGEPDHQRTGIASLDRCARCLKERASLTGPEWVRTIEPDYLKDVCRLRPRVPDALPPEVG
jgi:hypothetical protein